MLGGGGTLCKCKKVTYTGNVGQVVDPVDTANIWCKKVKPMQYAGHSNKNGYMVVGTSLIQKGQTHAVCRTQ